MGKYTTGQVYEIINNYHQMKVALGMETESVYGKVGGIISQYDNLGMPKATGGISNPTFNAAFNTGGIISSRMATDYKNKIRFIDERVNKIKKFREQNVLHWRLSGMQKKHIAELSGITDRHVRRILNDIAKKMSEMSVMSELSDVS